MSKIVKKENFQGIHESILLLRDKVIANEELDDDEYAKVEKFLFRQWYLVDDDTCDGESSVFEELIEDCSQLMIESATMLKDIEESYSNLEDKRLDELRCEVVKKRIDKYIHESGGEKGYFEYVTIVKNRAAIKQIEEYMLKEKVKLPRLVFSCDLKELVEKFKKWDGFFFFVRTLITCYDNYRKTEKKLSKAVLIEVE